MGIYYNPINGSPEVWDKKPKGYYTKEELDAKYPTKYFAKIGEYTAEAVNWNGAYTPSEPEMIEMQSTPVGDYHIAKEDGTWTCDLEKYRSEKETEITSKSNALMQQAKGSFTDGEKQTFQNQFDGATDILAGNTASTNAAFVTAILTLRLGHTPSEEELAAFCAKIQSNYNLAANATSFILGYQQNLTQRVKAATSEAELDAIVWE